MKQYRAPKPERKKDLFEDPVFREMMELAFLDLEVKEQGGQWYRSLVENDGVQKVAGFVDQIIDTYRTDRDNLSSYDRKEELRSIHLSGHLLILEGFQEAAAAAGDTKTVRYVQSRLRAIQEDPDKTTYRPQ